MRRREIREVVPTGHDRAVGHEARPQSAASLSALAQSGWSVDCSSPGHKVGAVRRLSGYSRRGIVTTRDRSNASHVSGRWARSNATVAPGCLRAASIVRFTIRGNIK